MKKQQRRSFKRSLLAVWMIVAIPLLVLLLFYNYVSMKIYSEKYIISSQSSLELHAQRFERDLASLDSLLSGIAASNYFSTFSTATTPLQAHNMAYTILSQYRTTIRTFGNEPASSLFIYNCEQTIYRDVFSENYDYQQQMSIRLFYKHYPTNNGLIIPIFGSLLKLTIISTYLECYNKIKVSQQLQSTSLN